ncbi:hypothetical protein [Marinobacter sp. F3R11]|uniref:hypothetical protein n=1 Tax=Marinobacter sp. F3R11 TaxID=2267231 RepID=UPI00165145FB|nr:hypothetical protein [Marinobacter sp. F3R11]
MDISRWSSKADAVPFQAGADLLKPVPARRHRVEQTMPGFVETRLESQLDRL